MWPNFLEMEKLKYVDELASSARNFLLCLPMNVGYIGITLKFWPLENCWN